MIHVWPERSKLAALAARANTIPLYCQILSDQLTPVTAFSRIAGDAEHAFLLESVVGGEKIARYSFIGTRPSAVFEATGQAVTLTQGESATTEQASDPLAHLEALLRQHRSAHMPDLPRFVGGAVGYAGYDTIRYYEHLPNAPDDDRGLPDLQFGLYDTMVVFDHVQKLVKVVAHAHVERDGLDRAYDAAYQRIERTVELLGRGPSAGLFALAPAGPTPPPFISNVTKDQFEGNVDRCREYIRAGDIFQVVLSHRLCVECQTDPFDVYRALRVVDPSPFMFFHKSPRVTLVGSSPEILCRVDGGIVTTRPLAGTRRRGRNEAEDLALEKELLADPKERAEHVMLVDLGRNDIGRVAQPGTIKLDELMTVERYSHVMHICSNVSARLAPGKTAFDALRAILPVGTVSGAPKVRAMQIVDELETTRRGPYAGAVGYFDFAGNMDTCIALRTLVITPGRNGGAKVYAQVGAGIVADSEPEAEYNETLFKARSMLRAIELADAWKHTRVSA